MRSFKKLSLVAAALMASTAMVQAADLIPAPTHDLPPEVVPVSAASGWYIRGDIGYASVDHGGVNFLQGPFFTGNFSQAELDDSFTLQGGIGYQVTDYFRVDGTIKYLGSSDFTGVSAPGTGVACNGFGPGVGNPTCDFQDNAELESATLFMANAYVDLGTVNGFTPYLGAGIGAARVKYGDLFNDQTCTPDAPGPVGTPAGSTCSGNDTLHAGEVSTRFAYAIHAGASYDVSCRTKIDAGYTYTHIEGGKQFGTGVGTPSSFNPGVALGGDGFDDGIELHEGRIGLRYALSDAGCHQPVHHPQVVYK